MNKTVLKKAHFQLTPNCNLNCEFCGQRKGVLSANDKALSMEKWLELAKTIKYSASNTGQEATICLWGGEPLLYPQFNKLSEAISRIGCRLEIISNGTLINQSAMLLNNLFTAIYVSFSGFGAGDDLARGAGTFERVSNNISLLRSRQGKLIFLFTITERNVKNLPSILQNFSLLKPDKFILQPLIYLSQSEIDEYRAYSKKHFACDYTGLQNYHAEDKTQYETLLRKELENIDFKAYDFELCFTPHAHNEAYPPCTMVNERVHIKYNGEVAFCTDFFGYSAGNVQDESLENIITSQKSQTFRKAIQNNKLSICKHCSWRCYKN